MDVCAFVRGSLYLEVRILPAQPASRVFFGSLQGLSKAGLIGVCLAVALTGCMGRPPDPVPVVQPQDRYMNCTAIYAEVRENNRRVRELGREQGWKVVQNVAAGVGGLFIPILWFGMDWQGTAYKEAAALQARQEYLGALAIQKRCGRPV